MFGLCQLEQFGRKNKKDGNIFLDAGQKKYHGKTSDKKKHFLFGQRSHSS